jgi:hypothetical protein
VTQRSALHAFHASGKGPENSGNFHDGMGATLDEPVAQEEDPTSPRRKPIHEIPDLSFVLESDDEVVWTGLLPIHDGLGEHDEVAILFEERV